MTPEELEEVMAASPDTATIGTFPGKDGTLLYGYDVDRRTWHVYQEEGELHLLVYRSSATEAEVHEHGRTLPALSLVPNKRLYPEGCDKDFCTRLRTLGAHLTFLEHGSMVSRPDDRGMVCKTHADFASPRLTGP